MATRVKVTSVLLGLGAASVAVFLVDPAGTHLLPPCPVYLLTGFYCPGCGSTRAVHQLLHGHFSEAFDLNPLAVVLLPFLGYALGSDLARGFGWTARRTRLVAPAAIYTLLVVILAFGVVRNIPLSPVSYLAP